MFFEGLSPVETHFNIKRVSFSRRGIALIWVAAIMMVIVGMAGLGIDGTLLYLTRNTCQVTADAAALAAVSQLPNTTAARAMAVDFGKKNMPIATNGTVVTNSDVLAGHWNPTTRIFTLGGTPLDAIKVTVRRAQVNNNPMKLAFAGIVGYSETDVVASAVASYGTGKPWNVLLVQDVTSSFSQQIPQARIADQALIDCLKSHTDGNSLVGLTVFTGCAKTLSPLQTISSSYTSISQSISALRECGRTNMPVCSGTDISVGLKSAVNQFTSLPPAADAFGQAIVLISDGVPNNDSKGCNPNSSNTQLRQLATQWADNAWANGISIFTVFYNESNNQSDAAFLASLKRGQGIALQTPDPTQLPTLLLQVCATLPAKLVD